MTHHNPISLSVEDLNNVDLSTEDAHKITLSVINWFYTQILNAIVGQASVKLGATALCSVLSKINAESAVVLGASGSLVAPARIVGSAGMALGATAEAEVTVTARIIALASVVLGAEAVMSTVSKIVGSAGVGLGGSANVVAPSKIDGAAAVGLGASGVAAVRSLLVAQSGASFGAQVAARCPAIIIGAAGMGLGATAELDAGSVALWTPADLGSSVLKLWLDAMPDAEGNFIGHKDASGYVDEWYDRSGNGNHATQSTGSYQPLYDGDDQSVNFYEDAMLLPSIATKAGMAVVRNVNGGTFNGSICALIGTYFNKSSVCLRRSDYTISLDVGDDSDSGDASVNGGVLTPGDGTGTSISILGFTPFPLHNEPDMTYWQINTVRSFNRLANHWAEFYRSKIDFHEILLFSDALSTSDRQKCEGYLAHKWGLQSNLPVDHPYKNSPPTVLVV